MSDRSAKNSGAKLETAKHDAIASDAKTGAAAKHDAPNREAEKSAQKSDAKNSDASDRSPAEPLWARLSARYRSELILFAFSFFAYALSSWGMFWHQSKAPHFVWQADAFLHFQLALTAQPPNLNDWVLQGGRWYVSFPPFPAVLMAPFVAIWGLAFNDTIFTIAFAALNVALFYRLLRLFAESGEETGARDIPAKPASDHAWLALLFGFGSLAWTCGIRGEVWFTAETLGVTLTLCYLLASVRARHPLLAGFFLGCATITRTPLAFSIVFFALEALLVPAANSSAEAPRASWTAMRRSLADRVQRGVALRRVLLFAVPLLAVGVPMAIANYVRFGDIAEFGHSHLYNNRVNDQIARYGLFNYAYLERNLHAAFTRLPVIELHPFRMGFDLHGMSILVTTPLFLYLLWPKETPRLSRALWLTVAFVALPGFFYQNDGFAQFGFRFSLDYTPYLFALLSLGGRALDGKFWALGFVGIAINMWGAVAFNRFF